MQTTDNSNDWNIAKFMTQLIYGGGNEQKLL